MALNLLRKSQELFIFLTIRILLLVFRLISHFKASPSAASRRLPPVRDPLLLLPATQLARKIRRREVSSVEVVQAYIDRIQEVNPLINAVVKDRFAAALQEATQVDKLIEEEKGGEDVLEDRLPLLGVPVSIKESFAVQGKQFFVIQRGDIIDVSVEKKDIVLPPGFPVVIVVVSTSQG